MSVANLRFLVVDDMKTMRTIVKKQLRDLGAVEIAEAENGKDAWNKLQEAAKAGKPVQFVVSDWNMPEMTGLDLLKQCRIDARYTDVAFLLVTAEAEINQVKEALACGVDNYVVKPFNAQGFQDKFMAVLRKRFSGKAAA